MIHLFLFHLNKDYRLQVSSKMIFFHRKNLAVSQWGRYFDLGIFFHIHICMKSILPFFRFLIGLSSGPFIRTWVNTGSSMISIPSSHCRPIICDVKTIVGEIIDSRQCPEEIWDNPSDTTSLYPIRVNLRENMEFEQISWFLYNSTEDIVSCFPIIFITIQIKLSVIFG